mmetsp:Transcript_46690/g.109871  ORF Transcript_46690/g.109871 Transcript_46690/m.109871 type:complete len:967 (-) Transcript_46690:258-3158(-)
MVELVHELDPMKPESVEERRQRLHAHEHTEREAGPGGDGDEEHEGAGALEANLHHCLLPEHLGELRVGEGEGPETEVGGGVGDAPEHVLDGVDHLVHHLLPKVELLAMAMVARVASNAAAVVGHGGHLSHCAVVSALGPASLVARVHNERLGQQERRDRDERDQDQEALEGTLARDELVVDADEPRLHEHLDEGVEEGRGALFVEHAVLGVGGAELRVERLLLEVRRVPVRVGLHNHLPLPLEHRAACRRRARCHAPHVLGQRRELGPVDRERGAGADKRSRPTRHVREVVFAVDLRDVHHLLVVEHVRCIPVGGPLEDDEEDEVAEDGVDEDHLGDVDEVERERVLEVERVHELAAHARHHLHDADHDRKLHLERVRAVQLVRRVRPPGVLAHRVDVPADLDAGGLLGLEVVGLVNVGPDPLLERRRRVDAWDVEAAGVVHLARAPHRRPEGLERDGEELVVDEARVGRKQTHHENVVPPVVDRSEHVVGRGGFELFLEEDDEAAGHGHHDAVPDVAEHDAEQERESDEREHRGVELLIARHTVRVHNGLEARGDLAGLEVGRRGFPRLEHVEHRLHRRSALERPCPERTAHVIHGRLRTPALGDESLHRDVVVELVQRVAHPFLPLHLLFPLLDHLHDRRQLLPPVGLGAGDDNLEVLHALVHLLHRALLPGRRVRQRVLGRRERLADLVDFLAGALAGEVDDEDALQLVLLPRHPLHLLELLVLQVHVPARRAEQRHSKVLDVVRRDAACNVAEHRGRPPRLLPLFQQRRHLARASPHIFIPASCRRCERDPRPVRLAKPLGGVSQDLEMLGKLLALGEELLVGGGVLLHLFLELLQPVVQLVERRQLRHRHPRRPRHHLLRFHLTLEIADDPQHVLALANILDEHFLESTLVLVQILELDGTNGAKLVESVMCSVILNEHLHIKHLLGPELRHVVDFFCLLFCFSCSRSGLCQREQGVMIRR